MKARWEEGTLTVTGGGSQTLRASGVDTDLNIDGGNLVLQGKADTDGAALTYAALENRGHLTIQASDNAISAFNTTLKVDGATFGSNSTTTFTLNSDWEPDGKLHPILRQHRGGKMEPPSTSPRCRESTSPGTRAARWNSR